MPIWVKLLILAFGLVFLATGLGIGIWGTRGAQAAAARAERLAPADATTVEAAAPGTTILVEATVSSRNTPLFRDFVAYSAEEYRGEEDSDGDPVWESLNDLTPRLILEVGGIVMVANEDYRIEGAHASYQDPGPLTWNGFAGQGSRRYTGLVAGRPITVIGTVTPGVEGNELRAEFLYAGTRAEYIAGQQQTAAFLPYLGAIFGLTGALIAGGGVFALFHR